MLTKKQHKLLLYIKNYITKNGFSPSYEEMKNGMELKSKSTIASSLKELEKKGHITTLPLQKRSIVINDTKNLLVSERENLVFIPTFSGSMNNLIPSFPTTKLLLNEKKKYICITNYSDETFKINKEDYLIFEETKDGNPDNLALYVNEDKKIKIDFYKISDKLKGILKIKVDKL